MTSLINNSSIQIKPAHLRGELAAPPSKSQTMRALLWASMADGISHIERVLPSPDTQAMVRACRALGAKIELNDDVATVFGVAGRPKPQGQVIDAGNSGQVLRFIPPLAALSEQSITITGDHSIRHNRPVRPLLEGLTQLGAECSSHQGYAPITVRGPIQSGTITVDGADSQPISGLIMAATFLSEQTRILVSNPGEKPWVGLTLSWLDRFGLSYQHRDFSDYLIDGGAKVKGFNYTVPGDFSSIAFPVVAALLTGAELTVNNVDMNDAQGDKQLITVLKQMGADIDIDADRQRLQVRGGHPLTGRIIDVNEMIDAVPILAVVGCCARGETRLINARVARQKESDRLKTMTVELSKMGADIVELPDGLVIRPGKLKSCDQLFSHFDHRVAMALSVAALLADSASIINDVSCVSKSYPQFFSMLQQLGVKVDGCFDRL